MQNGAEVKEPGSVGREEAESGMHAFGVHRICSFVRLAHEYLKSPEIARLCNSKVRTGEVSRREATS